MNYTEKYKEILSSIESLRTQIITDNMKYISFSGKIPKSELIHVEALLQAEGFLLSFLTDTYQLQCQQQDDIATVYVMEDQYTVPTKYLSYKKVEKQTVEKKEPMQAASSNPQPMPVASEPKEVSDIVKEELQPAPVSATSVESIPDEEPKETPLQEEIQPPQIKEEPVSEDIVYPAMPIEEVSTPLPAEKPQTSPAAEALNSSPNEIEDEDDIDKKLRMIEEKLGQIQAPTQQSFSVIGEVTDSSGEFPKVVKRVPASEVIYDRIKFTMTKKVGSAESFEVIASPLQLSNANMSSVPIIIVARAKGMPQIAMSSYDNEDGRNTITLKIKDYELLIRGCFQDGVYKTIILTTGKSVENGDVFEAKSIQSHGSKERTSEYGRPVLHYMSQEGLAWTTAIPLSEEGVEDFVVISKTPEFIDYDFHAADNLGGYRAHVYEDDNRKQVVPSWEDGMLELNIVNA